ncbi:MAG: hypothetical protein EXS13_05405 [Planctomycetes bacterium]|nr:hypothetical protein [Planctomycetota bacterium]
MRYWVDGYNVIHCGKLGAGASLRERRAELLARIAAVGMQAFVAFDSREAIHGVAESVPRRVEVAFSRDGKNADQLLLDKVRRAKDLRGVTLVSNDRDLLDHAPRLGVATMTVAAFVKLLKPVAARAPPGTRALSKREVDDWMAWFAKPRKPDEPGES